MGNVRTENKKRSDAAHWAILRCPDCETYVEDDRGGRVLPGPDNWCDAHRCAAITRAGTRCRCAATYPDMRACGIHAEAAAPASRPDSRQQGEAGRLHGQAPPAGAARTRGSTAAPVTRTALRRAGSPWRILVHERGGGRKSYDVSNDPAAPARQAETIRQVNEIRPGMDPFEDTTSVTVLEGTEFDELVIGRWIHLEQMDTRRWWINVGGVTINVRADRDGRPKRIDVFGPGDYADPEKGCTYEVTWNDGD